MANNPKRIQDPTEAAMSAIQEALNLREDPPAAASRRKPSRHRRPRPAADPFANMTADVEAERPARRRPARSDARDRRRPVSPGYRETAAGRETFGRGPAPADLEEVKPAQRAANDDRQSVGQVLQSMQRRPSRAPYMAAFFLSIAWVALGLFIGVSYFGTDLRGAYEPGRASDAVRACGRHRAARCWCSTCSRT